MQINLKDWSSSMATPWIERSLPYAGMVSAVVALAINQITSKMAMSNGTSFYILSVYSNALAALLLFPTAYLFHRYKPFPPFRSIPSGPRLILCNIWFLAAQSAPLYLSLCSGGFSFLLLLGQWNLYLINYYCFHPAPAASTNILFAYVCVYFISTKKWEYNIYEE